MEEGIQNENQAEATIERSFASFLLSTERFAVDVKFVKEVVKLSGLVSSNESIDDLQGFVELHSMRIPVLNTKKILSLKSTGSDEAIMVVNIDDHIFGLIVDIDSEVEVFSSFIKPNPLKEKELFADFVEGTLKPLDKVTYILDLGSLLSKESRALLIGEDKDMTADKG